MPRLSFIAALGVQWGIQTTDINNLKAEVVKIDQRVSALETVAQASQINAYRLSRLDASVDSISKKSADDHDILVRIDQTVQGIRDAGRYQEMERGALTDHFPDVENMTRKIAP